MSTSLYGIFNTVFAYVNLVVLISNINGRKKRKFSISPVPSLENRFLVTSTCFFSKFIFSQAGRSYLLLGHLKGTISTKI